MHIGLAESDITPTFATPLAGFGLARTACFTGVHDSLRAGCAVFEQDGEVVALVSCEVIGLNGEFLNELRSKIKTLGDFPTERLVLTCTHTHGAPVIQSEYRTWLLDKLAELVMSARADLRPRRLVAGRGSHSEWVGFNRRQLLTGFLPVDREVCYLGVLEPDGKARAVMVHYACHPSILGPGNLLITADWPGAMRQAIRERMGEDITVIYLKGTEGDINTGYSAGVSSLGVPIPTRTYETAERVGRVVADTFLRAWEGRNEFERPLVKFASRTMDLHYLPTDDLEAAREKVAWWEGEVQRATDRGEPEGQILQTRVEQAYARFHLSALEQIRDGGRKSMTVEQVAFRLGEAGFLNFPGEFFVLTGLETKQNGPTSLTFPLGITNDYLGYFPTAEAFPEWGYEVSTAKFQPDTVRRWTEAGQDLLRGLF